MPNRIAYRAVVVTKNRTWTIPSTYLFLVSLSFFSLLISICALSTCMWHLYSKVLQKKKWALNLTNNNWIIECSIRYELKFFCSSVVWKIVENPMNYAKTLLYFDFKRHMRNRQKNEEYFHLIFFHSWILAIFQWQLFTFFLCPINSTSFVEEPKNNCRLWWSISQLDQNIVFINLLPI